MGALRAAFVAACVAIVATQITRWSLPALAAGDPVFTIVFLLWITTWSSAAVFAALSVWEWVSPRIEEVISRMK